MTDRFPLFHISGGPAERGEAHGRLLKDRIHSLWAFYRTKVFPMSGLSSDRIKAKGLIYRDTISQFNPALAIELDHIAQGASIDLADLYALNARSEIMNFSQIGECTSLFQASSHLLAQTWDWIEDVEHLTVLIDYECDDGFRILTLTEPGMLAKIGLNSAGLGLCLNFLSAPIANIAVPVHVLCRALLSARSTAEAHALALKAGKGKSSHFLIADDHGDSVGLEFAGEQVFEAPAFNEDLRFHTNHCMAAPNTGSAIPGSVERLERAVAFAESNREMDHEAARRLLLDQAHGAQSIQRPYSAEPALNNLSVGSCATLLINLKQQVMEVKRGPSLTSAFHHYDLQ